MQHRLKRGRGFIIRNANREAAALRVPPVFEGAAHINDDAALTTTLRRRPACIGAAARTGDAQPAPLPALRRACRPHSASSRAAARTGDAQPAPLAPASSRRPAITVPPPSRRQTAAQPLLHRRPPWSQTPNICLTVQPYALQILTFRPFPIKPHEIFIGKG